MIHLTWRQARDNFLVARMNEQEMYPRADACYMANGTWPADYLAAKHATARAFEIYINAGYFSGITVPA